MSEATPRFYEAGWSGDDMGDGACADCGQSIYLSTEESPRTALCGPCYAKREQAMRTAAQKGFKLGL